MGLGDGQSALANDVAGVADYLGVFGWKVPYRTLGLWR